MKRKIRQKFVLLYDMERFVVSARKYRPDSFESLIGQDNIAKTLKNSVEKGQLAHAYLFSGPRGVGKTSTARIFAKVINCHNPGENLEPCGVCDSCVAFTQGRSYSIHELDAASNNSVDDIRMLTEQVRTPPMTGKYSVYIIDEVHMLSQSAFNAFLKTLEEPPPHAIFILATTEKHKILPTILSRCQLFDFNRISVDDIVKNLLDISSKEGVTPELEALHIIAQKADGAMRDALTLFDQSIAFCGTTFTYKQIIEALNVLDYNYYIEITNQMLKGEYVGALLIFDEILSKGFNALNFIGGLSSHFRDLLMCKESETIGLMQLAPTVAERYRKQAELCSVQLLYDALMISSNCEAGYKESGNKRLHIELALMQLCRINNTSQIVTDSSVKGVSSQEQQRPAVGNQVPSVAHSATPLPSATSAPSSTLESKAPETPATNLTASAVSTEDNAATQTSNAPSLSIKGLMNSISKENRLNNQQKNRVQLGEDPIDIEKLKEVWVLMAQSETSLPRLSTTISQTEPQIKGERSILFPVKNELQKNWIEKNCKMRLVEFLRNNLNNGKITLDIEVIPDDQIEEKMYMPHEKAKYITENYPEANELKNDLKLELK